MSDRQAELDRLMTEHALTARQVGDVVGRKPHTVRTWRCNGGRDIPLALLRLLKFHLQARARGDE